ncbi:MAG: 3-hydroxy-9,10-secoandrosta,3,5(10)-triene-9,17-dione monooxygenase reductase component [Frankiaceae bacterium]|nr:3-hydroxy-9,10-secoandrosta,3,5(10)-triene-9,17-dione monooxygenase reductase component [Frankiaceae bacterium]
MEPVTTDAFRRAAGRYATGIVVVTAVVDGQQHAMTVNSFTSVSLDPLLVLFCAEKIARFHDAVLAAGSWGVSVLGADGEAASRWFASRGRPLDGQLTGFPWSPGAVCGAALLDEAIATLECQTVSTTDGGDHTVVIGSVLSATRGPEDVAPLIYYEGRYRTL